MTLRLPTVNDPKKTTDGRRARSTATGFLQRCRLERFHASSGRVVRAVFSTPPPPCAPPVLAAPSPDRPSSGRQRFTTRAPSPTIRPPSKPDATPAAVQVSRAFFCVPFFVRCFLFGANHDATFVCRSAVFQRTKRRRLPFP